MLKLILALLTLTATSSWQVMPLPMGVAATRHMVKVAHIAATDSKCQPEHQARRCLQLSHWHAIMEYIPFDASEARLLQALLGPLDPPSKSDHALHEDSPLALLLCIDESAPYLAVREVMDRCRQLGIDMVASTVATRLPDSVLEIAVDLATDQESGVVSRRIGEYHAPDDGAIADEIRRRVQSLKRLNESTDLFAVVTVVADSLVPWSQVEAAVRAYQETGVQFVDARLRADA